ncbi:MAG: hypothetical protein AB1489_17750 [Acidobacteriota bacterium]
MRWGTLLSLGLLLCLSSPGLAQQRGKVLTNDDFPSGQRVDTKEEKTDDKDAKKEKSAKDDKADKAGSTEKAEVDKEKKEKETAWQKKYSETQTKLNALDRQKTEAELSLQELRNQLKRGGEPAQVESIASQLRSAEARLKDLNSQYAEAKKLTDDLKKDGSDKGYQEKKDEPPKEKDGRPNTEYYTKRYRDLSEQQRLAAQKLELYQSRINEARKQTYQDRSGNPNRVGNPYYTDPELKKSVEEAQTEYQKAQEELNRANQELERLQREAKSSGVSIR